MSTQLAKLTTSYDGDLPQRTAASESKEPSVGLVEAKGARATSTHSVGAEFYFKDVLFTQETPEFIL